MRRDKDDAAYLWDMLQSAKGIVSAVGDLTFEQYLHDDNIRLSVERRIEIIGEAARHVSESFQKEHPEIAWRPIIAQRHIVAHEYDDVDHEIIWGVIKKHVPDLIIMLEPLVPPSPLSDE